MLVLERSHRVYSLVTRARPVKISVDPDFNIFRDLYTEERPATLSSVFGSPILNFYFDGAHSEAEKFAQTWAQNVDGKSVMHPLTGDTFEPANNGALAFIGDKEAFKNFIEDCSCKSRNLISRTKR